MAFMNDYERFILHIEKVEQKLGYSFKNKSLLALAFVHCSFINENRFVIKEHNERLEFLGDSVLGILVAEYLYKELPESSEGVLSSMRSRLVEAGSCVRYIQKIGLESYIIVGKGEKKNHKGKGRDTILADLFEAIMGAIYLDGGIEAAKQFLFGHFLEEMEAILAKPINNWKAELQDFCQKHYQDTPRYSILQETGPDHCKQFEVEVLVCDKRLGIGEGSSKKSAEQLAAKVALRDLKLG